MLSGPDKRKISLSRAFAGQLVGIRELEGQILVVTFIEYDLGFFDEKEGRVEPTVTPFISVPIHL